MYKYTLKLYKTSSENNELDKILSDEKIVNGYSRVVVDMLNPTIQIAGIEINMYNYCYVQELNRYYFIDDITIHPNGSYSLSMKVDVLKTYKDDILESSGLILKNKKYNPYSGDVDVESRYTLSKHEFENGFDYKNGSYVLVTIRG